MAKAPWLIKWDSGRKRIDLPIYAPFLLCNGHGLVKRPSSWGASLGSGKNGTAITNWIGPFLNSPYMQVYKN